nr:3',5'-cyclic-nucleotide phosphodiesterase [Methylobacterium aerolatum]
MTGPALAKRGNDELKRYCTGDATTYCGDIDPDSKDMDACFTKHRAELSENCRKAIDAYQASGGGK